MDYKKRAKHEFEYNPSRLEYRQHEEYLEHDRND